MHKLVVLKSDTLRTSSTFGRGHLSRRECADEEDDERSQTDVWRHSSVHHTQPNLIVCWLSCRLEQDVQSRANRSHLNIVTVHNNVTGALPNAFELCMYYVCMVYYIVCTINCLVCTRIMHYYVTGRDCIVHLYSTLRLTNRSHLNIASVNNTVIKNVTHPNASSFDDTIIKHIYM